MNLSKRNRLLMGVTLFSMFFGAGNLIFPPYLAYQAGGATWPAMISFCISAIGFPILGVVAIAKCGGLDALAGRVHPKFAQVFILLCYLSIGPGLAIPRNAGTSFEMAVLPFLSEGAPLSLIRTGYSVVFFAVAMVIALRPEKLSDRMGKVLTPILLALIAAIFVGTLIHGGSYAPASGIYQENPFQGFIDGYQTMDAIAALNFGLIIALNIQSKGVKEEKDVVRETVYAGWMAGGLLLVVYCALAHVGGIAGGFVEGATNGAGTLTGVVAELFGPLGSVILAGIFVIACLNTTTGLLSCCSNYFHDLLPRVPYRAWVVFFAITSTVVANVGLDALLAISVPILGAIYPIALVLIVLGLGRHPFDRVPGVYAGAVLFAGIISLLTTLMELGVMADAIQGVLLHLPLYGLGLHWVLPAVVGGVLGALLSLLFGWQRAVAR